MKRLNNNSTSLLAGRQAGVAFLLFIFVVAIGTTSLLVGKLSPARIMAARALDTQRSLNMARDALLGYALDQFVPGLLPCPDIDGDGESDSTGSGCSAVAAWLPFRTLGLDALTDASGTRLWYAVDPEYTQGSAPFNSSTNSNLLVNNNPSAFVVLAANSVMDGQVRTAGNIDPGNYFEGVNADNNAFTYQHSETISQNDQLLGHSTFEFWSLMENSLVLPAAVDALQGFFLTCSSYPWATNFNTSGGNSINGLQQGSFPFGVAQDSANTGCTQAMSMPGWLPLHWGQTLQYSFCLNTQGQCLSITGDANDNSNLVLIAPGSPINGQSRPDTLLSQYFENTNQLANTQFLYRLPRNHDLSFNDVLLYLP